MKNATSSVRIAFVGGGSIGHLAPFVAVWRALKEESPKAEAVFLCSSRAEDQEYLRTENVRCMALPAIRRDVLLPLRLWQSYRAARALLLRERPQVVLSKGGGVALPACLAARRLKIPIVVHESDAVPGRATRIIGNWAAKTIADFPRNPVRPEITKGSRAKGLKLTGFSGTRPVLLVLGGSQGAQALNDAIARDLDALLKTCDIAHITGKGKRGARPPDGGPARRGYWSAPIVYNELPDLYAIADVCLSRAGAGAIAELAACAVPPILVPLRGVAHDHQLKNAEAIAAQGAGIVLPQERLARDLVTAVTQLLTDDVKRKTIAKRLHSLHTASASRQIAKSILECIAGSRDRT